jgi:hypothetical protein
MLVKNSQNLVNVVSERPLRYLYITTYLRLGLFSHQERERSMHKVYLYLSQRSKRIETSDDLM